MCGLAGFFSGHKNLIEQRSIHSEKIIESLRHRGPDHQSSWRDDWCYLAHSRLAIIDLDARSNQPFHSQTQQSVLVFNGEIYNYKDLSLQLQSQPRTSSDTEILTELLEAKSSKLLSELDGMFSFVQYDRNKKKLFLAVDPAGKKPLYTYWDGELFAFASEIKSFFAMNLNLEKDTDVVSDYLFFGYIPSPCSFYKNVQKLPAGHYLEVDLKCGPQKPVRYFHLPRTQIKISYKEAQLHVQNLISKAVEKRLISDRPVGFFLSGGVDSSVVCWEASQLLDKSQLKTFSASFKTDRESQKYDESSYAELVAKKIGSHHKTFEIQSFVEHPEDIVGHFDEPYADSSAFPTQRLCQEMVKEVTVALSGDGGDEIFGGYDRFRAILISEKIRFLRKGLEFASSLKFIGQMKDGKIRRFSRALDLNLLKRLGYWSSFYSFSDIERLSQQSMERLVNFFDELEKRYQGLAPLEKALHYNFEHYLQNDLLPKMDRMSMRHGLEVRSPLLDKALVEFAFQLPSEYKTTLFETKRILKDTYRQKIGTEIVDRPKKGFGFPLKSFFENHGTRQIEQSFPRHYSLADSDSKKYALFCLSRFLENEKGLSS